MGSGGPTIATRAGAARFEAEHAEDHDTGQPQAATKTAGGQALGSAGGPVTVDLLIDGAGAHLEQLRCLRDSQGQRKLIKLAGGFFDGIGDGVTHV